MITTTGAHGVGFEIHPDGAYDIIGTSIKIRNCYPALDGRPVRVTGVKIARQKNAATISYVLADGTIDLTFCHERDALVIKSAVTMRRIPEEFWSPFKDAEVDGGKKVYRSAVQIVGSAGIKSWPKAPGDNFSHGGATGLIPADGSTMVIATRDFSKYTTYTNIVPTENSKGKQLIEICVATEKVPMTALPDFYITENPVVFDAMQNEARAAAAVMKAVVDKPRSYHWCSWYYAYYLLTNQTLGEYLNGFDAVSPRIPVQTIQIDAGYMPHAGDWLEPSARFPEGLVPAVKDILARNYKAGIWIGPYMVGNRSKVFTEHPDWILRKTDGTPIINSKYYNEGRLWGATDEEIYTLDTSNPEAMEYLRQVFRGFRKMGFTFYKTDFMVYGMHRSDQVKRHTPGKTSNEYQREFFKMIREEIGPESFWLGCIAPFPPMLGFVDAMRISADTRPSWDRYANMFEESIGNQPINNIWWQNDPDVVILRDKFCTLTDDEVQSVGLWMGMLGGVINTSDLFHSMTEKRRVLFRFLEPGAEKLTASIPFVNKSVKFDVLVRRYPAKKAWAVLFVNRNEEKTTGTFALKEIIGEAEAVCFAWQPGGGGEPMGVMKDLPVDLAPHESVLFYCSMDGTPPGTMTLGGKE